MQKEREGGGRGREKERKRECTCSKRLLEGSIKASVEDSVETLQSDSLKETVGRRDADEDSKVRHGKVMVVVVVMVMVVAVVVVCGEREEGGNVSLQ